MPDPTPRSCKGPCTIVLVALGTVGRMSPRDGLGKLFDEKQSW
jgi:hypothetical protein